MPYALRVTWAEGQYQGTSPTTISANVGNAVANGGGQAAIATSIAFGVGDAVAAGSAFGMPDSVPFTVGNADGAGSVFAVNEALAAGVGGAVAAGATPAISEAVALLVGDGAAAGSPASVYIYSARVTWAELQYEQAIVNTTINCNVGNANSGGPIGAAFSVDSSIQMGTANAAAAGLPFGYSSNTQVKMFIANAVAAGKRAGGFIWSIQTTPSEVWTPVTVET